MQYTQQSFDFFFESFLNSKVRKLTPIEAAIEAKRCAETVYLILQDLKEE